MSRILSSDPITPREFAEQYFMEGGDNIEFIQDLYAYMNSHPDEDYWDYSLDDTGEILENEGAPVVLVKDITGEMRWFETSVTPNSETYFDDDYVGDEFIDDNGLDVI